VGFASVYGQATERMTVNVPFNFKAGEVMLPAGHYTITPFITAGTATDGLILRHSDGHANAILFTMPVEAHRREETSRLVFNRYQGQYFLSKVWIAGRTLGRELPKSRAERELVKNSSPNEWASVAILP